MIFANSLDPDQAGQNIWPDQVFLKDFFEKLMWKKSADNTLEKVTLWIYFWYFITRI